MSKGRKIVKSNNANNRTPIIPELQRGLLEVVNITPPQAGGNVIIQLPVGANTYKKVVVPNNIPEDKIREIKVLVNDKALWEFDDAVQMRNLSKRYNETLHPATGSDSAMTFNFERKHLVDSEKMALGLGTLDIQKLSISFKIDTSVSNPQVSAYAFVGRGTNFGISRIIRTIPFNSAVAGELSIVNPFLVNKANQAKVIAVHFLRSDITNVDVMRGATISHKKPKFINNVDLLESGRQPDNDTFMLDFNPDNTLANSLTFSDTANSFITLKPTVPSAGSCNMLVEYLGALGSA
jgi:hypothetical protein